MMSDNRSYHERRAATQRMLAQRSGDPKVANAHKMLADLHDQRAAAHAAIRPILRVVTLAS